MKIDEMSDIQDVMKCSKDKKYAAQMRGRIKEIKKEQSILRKQAYELNKSLDILKNESQKINRILAQAKGCTQVNDTSISIVSKGRRYIHIDRAGDYLGKYDRHDFTITKDFTYQKDDTGIKSIRVSVVGGVTFGNKHISNYDYKTSEQIVFPDINIIKEIGCKYVGGIISADEAEIQIKEACSVTKVKKKW